MTTPGTQYQFRAGDDVMASDGDKVGSLADLHGTYLVVEKGFFFPKDYFIPYTTVSSYDENEGKIFLSVTKDEALNSGWDQKPDIAAEGYPSTTASAGTVDDRYATDRTVRTNDQTSRTADRDTVRVPVHEEDLVPTKTVREAGQVRVNKSVIEEDRSIDVPVTEESVRVTRRAVDRVADSGDMAFEQESIDVPLRTEDVNLDKVVRVSEEVDIDKKSVQGTKRVSGTVRKEVVDVDESGSDASIYSESDRRGETASS